MKLSLSVPLDQEAYWQQYPFGGPNRQYNLALLEHLRQKLDLQSTTPGDDHSHANIKYISYSESEYFLQTRFPGFEVLEESFIWKFKMLYSLFGQCNINNILCVGVGYGHELLMIRNLFPFARIKAIDWTETCNRKIRESTNCEYVVGNVFDLLSVGENEYQLIFSHHFFEHLYRPDYFLALVRNALTADGWFVAGVPMLLESTAYTEYIARLSERPHSIKLLDLSLLNIGHPLQLSFQGMKKLLQDDHGFRSVCFGLCPEMITRNKRITRLDLDRRLKMLISRRLCLVKPFSDVFSILLEFLMKINFPLWPMLLRAWIHYDRKCLGRLSANYIASLTIDSIVVARVDQAI